MAEATGIERFLGLLSDPKVAKQIADAQVAAVTADQAAARAVLIRANSACESDLAKKLPGLRSAADDAVRQERDAEKVLDARRDARASAMHACVSASLAASAAIARNNAVLLGDITPESRALLDAGWTKFQNLWADNRKLGQTEEKPTGLFFRITGEPEVQIWSNKASLERRLAALRAAQREITDLPLTQADISPDAIARTLAELEEALPPLLMEKVGPGAVKSEPVSVGPVTPGSRSKALSEQFHRPAPQS
jgi:hypothetical protein